MYIKEYENFTFLIGCKIDSVYRKFFERVDLNNELSLHESDGSIVLVFKNGYSISFYPNTEKFTITYEINENLNYYDLVNLGHAKFWKRILGKSIINIEKQFEYDKINPSGIIITLDNLIKIKILYVSESEFTFDALIIRKEEIR
jgi:hypothetical protein